MRVKVSHVRAMCVEVSFRRMGVTCSRRVCRDRMLVVVCVQDPQRNKCGGEGRGRCNNAGRGGHQDDLLRATYFVRLQLIVPLPDVGRSECG